MTLYDLAIPSRVRGSVVFTHYFLTEISGGSVYDGSFRCFRLAKNDGSLYDVVICRTPELSTCDCPASMGRTVCKHIRTLTELIEEGKL